VAVLAVQIWTNLCCYLQDAHMAYTGNSNYSVVNFEVFTLQRWHRASTGWKLPRKVVLK